jgi:hypothetical protein
MAWDVNDITAADEMVLGLIRGSSQAPPLSLTSAHTIGLKC